MKKQWIPIVSACTIAALAFLISGCGQKEEVSTPAGAEPATQTQKLKIEASFYPMYEFASRVAGDLADVHLLIPADTEPHDWEPTPKDIENIEKADVLVYNGAGLEGWVDQILGSSDNKNLSVIEASKGLELIEGKEEHGHGDDAHSEHADGKDQVTTEDHAAEADHSHEHVHDHNHDHGGMDPHVWLSPQLAVKEVRNIEAALIAKAPEHQEQFTKNADAYVAKLEQLDADYKKELQNAKRKDFITQHAAFGYLAKTYGLTQVPIAGLSPEQEPSASGMAEVVKFAKEHQVKTIFFETLVSSQVADTIAKELGAQTAVLNPLEGLTADEQAQHMDYISVMRANLEALKKALNE
ncbi:MULTISPECIES: metal ABC transporter substrate-binding protein [Paenibacillus]|uniref:High-affinity zinc uptake system binding-protein ZnuA n=1 Tax=Paenibacillus albilobatus TaxID=2716884 RepID=A0A920CA09_9BACL|nr:MULTISPECIES: metal ABC transporter substrate-binding protein [Paenibacillus]GIO29664.1 high-affinity zinc uptake system binding-protein ZnuA [Paenibacillus albilobatus]